ncbi:hypothetical protein [Budvicia aquatica]|uniref:Uncharacterized protein n=1 Tax=Budvicia aquatica TaxID=82979 RepID=A0A2C6CTA2_9GAMM|nr:hypothetical protein [Budvicia aquatica]PHI29879.1 hypothetical protein CRN84_11285 [Budvicia aquatica]VFS48560.1 Uncharacterised protein [Budvicia aquatica]
MKKDNFSFSRLLLTLLMYVLGCALVLVVCYLAIFSVIFLVSGEFNITLEEVIGCLKIGAIGGLVGGVGIEIRKLVHSLFQRPR